MKDKNSRSRDIASPGRRRALRPSLEGLEDRLLLYSVTGDHFTYGSRITWSLMPDGTTLGGVASNLIATMNQKMGVGNWLPALEDAFAQWEDYANVNFAQVPDDGAPWGSGNDQQGDPNMGDIRIGGYFQGGNILAFTALPPAANGGSDSGDILFNTNQAWNIGSNVDFETVALHEIGHALGMGHSTSVKAVMYPYYGGVEQTLSSDDIQGVQSIWGPRKEDPIEQATDNLTYTNAANVTGWINTSNNQVYLPSLDVASSAESYWYKVTTPANASGTFTVQVQSTNLSELSPRVVIFSSSLQGLVQAEAPVNAYGATIAATVTNSAPNTTYYVRVLGSSGNDTGTGGYAMTFNMGGGAIAVAPPPVTTVAAQPDQGGGADLMTIGSLGSWIKSWILSAEDIPLSTEETEADPGLEPILTQLSNVLAKAGPRVNQLFDDALIALIQDMPLGILDNSEGQSSGQGQSETMEEYLEQSLGGYEGLLGKN